MRGVAVLLLATLVLPGGCQRPLDAGRPPASRPQVFVDAATVQENLGRPRFRVLHVGHGRRNFDRNHLPGAAYVDVDDTFREADGLSVQPPAMDDLAALLAEAGVGAGDVVVLYGDAAGSFPARLCWTLRQTDADNTFLLLDGQLRGWLAQDKPVEAAGAEPPVRAAAARVLTWLGSSEAETGDVAGPAPGVVLVDVRPAEQFSGVRRGVGVDDGLSPGHIPGAVHLPWQTLIGGVREPYVKPRAELEAMLRERGIRPRQPMIVYDNRGLHASFAALILEDLGHPVRLYDGGYQAWAATFASPAVSDSDRR